MSVLFGCEDIGAIVIDNGSSTIRAGYSGDNYPKIFFPSSIGCIPEIGDVTQSRDDIELQDTYNVLRGYNSENIENYNEKESSSILSLPDIKKRIFLGESQGLYRENVEIVSPIQHGLIMDWDLIEILWEYTFVKRLNIKIEEHPILMTETILNTRTRREKMIELLFERFNTPATYLAKDAALSSFSYGMSNSLVISSGSSITSIVPVWEGTVLQKPSICTKIAGDSIDALIQDLLLKPKGIDDVPTQIFYERIVLHDGTQYLQKRNIIPTISLINYNQHQIIRDIKHTSIYIHNQPFDTKVYTQVPIKSYELPDGKIIDIGVERYIIGESLFNPTIGLGKEIIFDLNTNFRFEGIHHIVKNVINSCDPDLRKELFHSIILSGGTTTIPDFSLRLEHELGTLLPPGLRCKVHSSYPVYSQFDAPWIGGSILSSLPSLYHHWYTLQEYEEHGTNILLRKCI